MMEQPSKEIIIRKLKEIQKGYTNREEVSDWAMKFIDHDDEIEIKDLAAWHLLVTISGVGEKTSATQYLYSNEDIQIWITKDSQ